MRSTIKKKSGSPGLRMSAEVSRITFLRARLQFCSTALFLDGPPKALEGVGQRWPRRAIKSFQNLPKNQKRTRLNALLVFPGLTAPGWRLPRVLGYSIPAFLAGVRGGWRIPVWPGSSFLIDRSGGRMVLF